METLKDYMTPTMTFAKELGISTSRNGRIIMNNKNWNILESFLKANAKSTRGTAFDGMVDGHSSSNRTIEQAINRSAEVFKDKYSGSGVVFYPDRNELNIGDCTAEMYFSF